jgi:hypothetical protein
LHGDLYYPPAWNGPEEPIQRQIRSAFKAQAKIGWDQFFRGRIAKAWRKPIGTYYKIRQTGESFTQDQWMQTVIKERWEFSPITIRKQRNAELHGTDGAISMERRRKDTVNEAAAVYQATLGNVSPMDRVGLSFTILTLMKYSIGPRSTWMPILLLPT